MTTLERAYEDETSIFLRVRNVAFIGWRNAPSVAAIRAWQRIGHTIRKDHASAGACIDIIVRGTPRFGEDVRKAAEEMARDTKIFGSGIAHVTLIPGLAGTAVRTFIQTILLVARPPTPTKVFADLHTATKWMTPRIATNGWTETELRATCDELVALLQP